MKRASSHSATSKCEVVPAGITGTRLQGLAVVLALTVILRCVLAVAMRHFKPRDFSKGLSEAFSRF